MKALIVGNDELGHDELVRLAFVAGGGVTADLYNISAFNQTVIDYAKTNNYDAIIYSYENVSNYLTLANSNPDVMIFMPTHSSFAEQLQQLVVTESVQDLQGGEYEFNDNSQTADSYSNGYIAGQLFYIAAQRNCSLSEARICANATKSEDGIIDVNAAIAYTGTIALTVGTLTAVRGTGFSATLTLERIIDATNYTIEVKDVEDIETTSLSNSYNLPDYDIYYFRYKGYNADLESDWSEWQVIPYPAIKHLIYRT